MGLSSTYWYSCLACCFTYISVVNYVMIASSILQNRYNYTKDEAGYLFTGPYYVAAFVSPMIGAYVNKYGNRMQVTLVGSAIGALAHASSFYDPDHSEAWIMIVRIYLLGINYATYCVVLWGSLPYMVDAKILGIAFGICTAF
jgi:MFS family permease